jgi:hypothetical protein
VPGRKSTVDEEWQRWLQPHAFEQKAASIE